MTMRDFYQAAMTGRYRCVHASGDAISTITRLPWPHTSICCTKPRWTDAGTPAYTSAAAAKPGQIGRPYSGCGVRSCAAYSLAKQPDAAQPSTRARSWGSPPGRFKKIAPSGAIDSSVGMSGSVDGLGVRILGLLCHKHEQDCKYKFYTYFCMCK